MLPFLRPVLGLRLDLHPTLELTIYLIFSCIVKYDIIFMGGDAALSDLMGLPCQQQSSFVCKRRKIESNIFLTQLHPPF
jgi:hypothetical protein